MNHAYALQFTSRPLYISTCLPTRASCFPITFPKPNWTSCMFSSCVRAWLMLSRIFVAWAMRRIILKSEQLVAFFFFGKGMQVDFTQSFGKIASPYISLYSLVKRLSWLPSWSISFSACNLPVQATCYFSVMLLLAPPTPQLYCWSWKSLNDRHYRLIVLEMLHHAYSLEISSFSLFLMTTLKAGNAKKTFH